MDLVAMKQSFQCDALSRFKMRLGTHLGREGGETGVPDIP